MLIEYHIKLPLSLDQYHIAHLHTTMEMSKEYTSVGEGVEILENTPCDSACLPHKQTTKVNKVQRTSKRYYIPTSITSAVGLDKCILGESSFNCFPYLKTNVVAESGTNGEFMIDTICGKGNDLNKDNVFRLPQVMLDKRSVVDIDIITDTLPLDLIKDDEDPKKVLGLDDDWQSKLDPKLSMIVYKLVSVSSRDRNKDAINALVVTNLRNMFNVFHRKLVCSGERWKGLNIEDIRTMEYETKEFLDKKRKL